MPSLRDVARLADVSVTTASKILNTRRDLERFTPDCISRVHDAARQVNYTPNYHAQRLRSGRSMTVGVPLETEHDDALGNPYFANLLNGMRVALKNEGLAMTIFSSAPDRSATTQSIQQLRQGGLDGLLIPGTLSKLHGRVWSDTADLPIVMLEPRAPMPFPCLDMDFAQGITLALEHLTALGHRRVLWLGPEGQRYQAFASAAWQHGLQGAFCGWDRKEGSPADLSGDSARAENMLARYLAGDPIDFTAVVCWNDLVAAGALRALRAAGKDCPGDVSVVGFDNYFSGILDPPLTTVSHRLFDMGHRAAEMLLALIEQPLDPHADAPLELMQPELVIRRSTGPAPR